MDGDLPESRDKALNRLVALTVLLLSTFMAVENIKDDNIIQAIALAKSDAVDTWSEYQATRTKLHVAETARREMTLIAGPSPTSDTRLMVAGMAAEVARYNAETPRLRSQAKADEARYDALNVRDDQFDLSDALISIAISLAAVAALAETRWLLVVSWVAGAIGLVFGVAGFAGWLLHPDALTFWLG